MTPLALLPFKAGGVLFTLVKIACLALLMWGAVRFSPAGEERPTVIRLLVAVATLVALQPITSDVGNGQINLIVSACGVGGIWMLFANRRWWWLACVLVGVAVAIKATPALLLGLPFLRRKWKEFFVMLAATALILAALPAAWYGRDLAAHLGERFRERSLVSIREVSDRDRQTSLHEVIVFVLSQSAADPAKYRWDSEKRQLYLAQTTRADGKPEKTKILPPFSPQRQQLIWLAGSAVTGLLFLALRWRVWRGREVPWAWDLATLVVLQILLAPLVRRAHLVVLLPAIGYMAGYLYRLIAPAGWKAAWRDHRALLVSTAFAVLFFLLSDDLVIPVPGHFPVPCYPGLFLAQIGFLVVLFQMTRLPAAAANAEAARLESALAKSE